MKCVRNKKTGKINRVTDEEAQSAVTKGIATYCHKSEWKASLSDKERKSIMNDNGGDPSFKKSEGKKAKKSKIAKIDTSDVEKVETPVEVKGDKPATVEDGNDTFAKDYSDAANVEKPIITESKAKRNKKDKPEVKGDNGNAKEPKKEMVKKPKVKPAKE